MNGISNELNGSDDTPSLKTFFKDSEVRKVKKLVVKVKREKKVAYIKLIPEIR